MADLDPTIPLHYEPAPIGEIARLTAIADGALKECERLRTQRDQVLRLCDIWQSRTHSYQVAAEASELAAKTAESRLAEILRLARAMRDARALAEAIGTVEAGAKLMESEQAFFDALAERGTEV